jgi:hypothetical protein
VSAYELISALADKTPRKTHDIVHDYWKSQHKSDDFEEFWPKCLHDGVMPGTSFPPQTAPVKTDFRYAAPAAPQGGLELQFMPDPTIFDGRFANNGWLQELPKPLTKLTWDNAAFVSPATAARLGLQNEDVVKLRAGGRSVEAPVWIVPGQADNCVTVTLGYGRTRAGKVHQHAELPAPAELRTRAAVRRDFFGEPRVRNDREAEPDEIAGLVGERAEPRDAEALRSRLELGEDLLAEATAARRPLDHERADFRDVASDRRELAARHNPIAGDRHDESFRESTHIAQRPRQQMSLCLVLDDEFVDRDSIVAGCSPQRHLGDRAVVRLVASIRRRR